MSHTDLGQLEPIPGGNVNLLGARLSNVDKRDAAYVVYEVDGSKVSVLVFDGKLLAYFDVWRGKLDRFGLEDRLPKSVKPPDKETFESWKEYLRGKGVPLVG